MTRECAYWVSFSEVVELSRSGVGSILVGAGEEVLAERGSEPAQPAHQVR